MSDRKLVVKNLSLLNVDNGEFLLQNISFQLKKGKILGLFGNSGSGKSILCKSLLNIHAKNLHRSGEITFNPDNENIDLCQRDNIKKIRGEKIAIMFQNTLKSLNPMLKNKTHLYQLIAPKNKIQIASKILRKVGFNETTAILNKYPNYLSGGELSRFGFAMTMAKNPDILILDEAFASIDEKLQKIFMKLIKELAYTEHKSIILVTHNISILNYLADSVLVLENGKIVESAANDIFFQNPKSDYVKKLLLAYWKLYGGG